MRSESVDLVYLDPPFKSNQTYNIIYKERNGAPAAAQEKAFGDTWTWDLKAAKTYRQVIEAGGPVAETLEAFRRVIGTVDKRKQMLAYLTMMAPRLIELRRVLKVTGSLYLHCDSSASHYLKVLLDAVFGAQHFRNEIIWKRTSAHSSAKRFGPVHDVILFYGRSDVAKWNPHFQPHATKYLDSHYGNRDAAGRRYTLSDLTAAGVRHGSSGQPWRGFQPTEKGNHWKFTTDRLDKLDAVGRIYWPAKTGGWPRYIRYLDEVRGTPLQDVWTDIDPVNAKATERRGFPTQKPKPLLDRIISASSDDNDLVLDPFCGCGTTIEVAQTRNRRWIGIDITHLAIKEVEDRLVELGIRPNIDYRVDARFAPKTLPDVESMAKRDKQTFQGWALQQAGIEPFQLKPGPDRGIDARRVFFDPAGSDQRREIIVSVKGGKLKAGDVRDLIGTVQRERAQIGVLITLHTPTAGMRRDAADIEPYRGNDGRMYSAIQILTVEDLLDGKVIEYPLQVVPRYEVATVPMVPTLRKAKQGSLLTEDEVALHPRTAQMAKAALAEKLKTLKPSKRTG